MTRAHAKINLALVVGPLRADGKHEVATVLQRIELSDGIDLERTATKGISVEGFTEDTLVRTALKDFADAAGHPPSWCVRIEKRIPVAAGLGGGSADAAVALELANALLTARLSNRQLQELAARVGADVPFFLADGPQLGTGDGSELAPLVLPHDYWVLLALPEGVGKESTAAVYRAFDAQQGAVGFEGRRTALLDALDRVVRGRDLAALPKNDLGSSPLAGELEGLGAFRADVSGAGPAVYGLFERQEEAEQAAKQVRGAARTWVVRPVG